MAEGAQQKQLARLQSNVVETTIHGTIDAAGQKRLQDVSSPWSNVASKELPRPLLLLQTIQKTAEQEYIADLKKQEHEAALKAVKCDAADVAMIQTQFGLAKATAERKLRECGGDAARAVRELIGV